MPGMDELKRRDEEQTQKAPQTDSFPEMEKDLDDDVLAEESSDIEKSSGKGGVQ
jgi:hypothetical protein